MATAFETQQQASSHASNILRNNEGDPNSEGVNDFMENKLSIYPGPYRTAFREFINDKRKWAARKERMAGFKANK